ncbi:Putative U3 snoRNA associated [Colletotrichum destructivum]|uniref:U3 snoRNA associated n=1 Tax=Colletotrichum destructivum TaxID=34406 RepID=A0AAX4HYZ5_9PEZI|nr:Putative U3 snoRNA associated [Colletotrichum destructivum]
MVTTRNGKRTAAEAPATETETTKKQKLPVRAKGGKAAPKKASSKKDESGRSSSKKRSSLVVELRSEASPADAQEVHEEQVITGAEQPAPEPEAGEEGKVIKDSDASVSDDQEEEKQTVLVAEGDDGSDSDEAPEAVSTSKAAVQAKKSAQAANKAIAEQQATQKRKRQERNARLQEQAAVRKAQEDTAAAEKSNEGGEEEEEEEEAEAAQAETTGRRRLNKLDLPSELPAEYLESDSEDESGGGETDRKPRKARKLHTAEAQIARESRGPKDEVVGTTVFRVVKKEDERLAPRAQKSSVNAKKALLARGRAPVKARKGFLV